MNIIITSPSLDTDQNVSGISSVARFIIESNKGNNYFHFQLGKKDDEGRGFVWILRLMKTYFKWANWILSKKNALIHFNLAVDKFGLLRDSPLIFFARLAGKRVIIHLHGGEFLLNKQWPLWMKLLLRLHFTSGAPIVVLSEIEKELIESRFNPRSLFVLPNCIDLSGSALFQRGREEPGLRILFMGRICSKKGIYFIYEALRELKESGISFHFIMAGKGPEDVQYVKTFQALLGDKFIFKGVVSGDEKTDVLKQCNVFVLPSFFEGMPIALLEAMSFGLVPVTTDVGSIKYLVKNGKNGFIVKKKSSAEIFTVLKELAVDPLRLTEMGKSAKTSIFQQYDPQAYLEKLNEIYVHE
jgi:glycosyltransferase involved in cell wall biosynthesis